MTEVMIGDEVIKTDLPAEAVADLQQPAEQPTEAPKAEEKAPEPTEKPAEGKAEEANAEPKQEQPKATETATSRKPKPIADLLSKKHELETTLEAERREKAELQAKLQQLSQQQPGPQITDKVKAVAEQYGLNEEIVAGIVNAARDGFNPALPKEVQDLIAENQRNKEIAAEEAAFTKRVDGLAKSLNDEILKNPEVREKLKALAYSTDKAPDGEPYFQKEIAELYFAYVKPEFEPGKVSAEPSRGGSNQVSGDVLDFDDLLKDDAKMEEFTTNATSEQWSKFTKWRDEKQGDTPIIRRNA